MQPLDYTLSFNTPAFLGNAEQNAQWRTPPIKALLRQWWRVAYAADQGFNVNVAAMRHEEGLLFGNAWLNDEFCKSRVRMRLGRWDKPKIGNLGNIGMVCHPEVNRTTLPNCPNGGVGKMVDSGQYLGYGPFQKANAAIQAGESATLSLAVPEADAPLIKRALWLMNRFGTLGGRSRNGWGSFSLRPLPPGEGWGEGNLPLRPWQDCLQLDWPHAIGTANNSPLIWQTQPFGDWRAVMQRLAQLKVGLRTQFAFPNAAPGPVHQRHWLSYPVTNHRVDAWGNNARLPNTLRFKVRRTVANQFVGVIVHVPHTPPAQFHSNAETLPQVWSQVYNFLDAQAQTQTLTRIAD